MRNLRFKSDTLSQKEFAERMTLLESKFSQLDQDLSVQSFDLDQLLGLSKKQHRSVKNLAELTAQPLSREELMKEQQQATEFIKKLRRDK